MQPLKLGMVGSVSSPIIGKGLENEKLWALFECNTLEFVETTWEPEEDMRITYPQLFQGTSSFGDEASLRRVDCNSLYFIISYYFLMILSIG